MKATYQVLTGKAQVRGAVGYGLVNNGGADARFQYGILPDPADGTVLPEGFPIGSDGIVNPEGQDFAIDATGTSVILHLVRGHVTLIP